MELDKIHTTRQNKQQPMWRMSQVWFYLQALFVLFQLLLEQGHTQTGEETNSAAGFHVYKLQWSHLETQCFSSRDLIPNVVFALTWRLIPMRESFEQPKADGKSVTLWIVYLLIYKNVVDKILFSMLGLM